MLTTSGSRIALNALLHGLADRSTCLGFIKVDFLSQDCSFRSPKDFVSSSHSFMVAEWRLESNISSIWRNTLDQGRID